MPEVGVYWADELDQVGFFGRYDSEDSAEMAILTEAARQPAMAHNRLFMTSGGAKVRRYYVGEEDGAPVLYELG